MKPTLLDVTEGGLTAEWDETPFGAFVTPALSDEIVTLVSPLRTVAGFRLDDARFGFDHSFLEPECRAELVILKALLDRHEPSPITVFGHADPTGRDDYNKRLSGRRAEAFYGLLTRRVDLWEALADEPHGDDAWGELQLQKMLAALGHLDETPRNTPSEASRAATRAFQAAHDLDVDGKIGPATRPKLIAAYMDAICVDAEGAPWSLEPSRFLGKGADPRGKAEFQGCGELNPVLMVSSEKNQSFQSPKNKAARDAANAPNRRILVYVFAEGTVVDPQQWPCPRSREGDAACKKRLWSDSAKRRQFGEGQRTFLVDRDTFACRFYHGLAMRSPCETSTGARRVRLEVLDATGQPHKVRPVVLVGRAAIRHGITDEQGRVDLLVPDGDHRIELPGHLFAHLPGDEQKYEFAKHEQYRELIGPEIDPSLAPPRAVDDDELEAHLRVLDELSALAELT